MSLSLNHDKKETFTYWYDPRRKVLSPQPIIDLVFPQRYYAELDLFKLPSHMHRLIFSNTEPSLMTHVVAIRSAPVVHSAPLIPPLKEHLLIYRKQQPKSRGVSEQQTTGGSYSRGYVQDITNAVLLCIEAWRHKLQKGLEALVPNIVEPDPYRRSKGYKSCHILFIYWAMDNLGGCSTEAENLGEVLEELEWIDSRESLSIPLDKQNEELQVYVEEKIADFTRRKDCNSNLLLFHYGGHGRITPNGRRFVCKMGLNEVNWQTVRDKQIYHVRADVGILMDACTAESATYRRHYPHAVELIGCPEGTITPQVGPRSFTRRLIEYLQSYTGDVLVLKNIPRELEQPLQDSGLPLPEGNPMHYMMRTSANGNITLRKKT